MRPTTRAAIVSVCVLLLISLLIACGASAPAVIPQAVEKVVVGPAEDGRGLMPELPMATAAPAEAGGEQATQPPLDSAATETAGQRMVIQTANVVARVKDVQVAVAETQRLAASYGGYIVSLNTWTQDDLLYATLSVRVPAERFEQMLQQVDALAHKVESSSITGEDVTEEYYDVEARLRALRATEEQLVLLLADVRERMKTAEDILAVYRELQNIQSQIEQLEGRKRFLENQVALSTINLNLLPVEAEPPVVAAGWRPLSTARDALRSLTRTGQGLIEVLIWVVLYVLPVVLVLAAPFVVLVLIVRAITRRRRNRAKPPAAASE